jgi:hypothetical protein
MGSAEEEAEARVGIAPEKRDKKTARLSKTGKESMRENLRIERREKPGAEQ